MGPGHWIAFGVIWLLAMGLIVVVQYPYTLRGDQLDADGYMRLVRVGELVENWAWFENRILRVNWPIGDVIHWTRLLDVLMVALAVPLMPFVGVDAAVHASGSLISPVLHLASCLALIWVATPVASQAVRALAAPALLVQPIVFTYGLPGRADHHALITFLFVLTLGTAIRWMLDPSRERWAFATGILAALGLWVSPEFLLPLALFLGAGAALWIRSGEAALGANLALAMGLALGVTCALALERPPGEWLTAEYDRISIAHWTMSMVGLGFWLAVAGMGPLGAGVGTLEKGGRGPGRRRLAAAALGGPAAGLVLAAVHPDFYRGPWISADPEVRAIWLDRVQELQPLIPGGVGSVFRGDLVGLGRAIATLGPALVVVPFGLWQAWKGPRNGRLLWGILAGATAFFAAMTLVQLRWAVYAGVLVALGITAFLGVALARIDGRAGAGATEDEADGAGVGVGAPRQRTARHATARYRTPRRRILRMALVLGAIPGFSLVGYGVEGVVMAAEEAPPDVALEVVPEGEVVREGQVREGEVPAAADARPRCPIARIAPVLESRQVAGLRPVTVMAHVDRGPEIVFRTHHRVLAGPYHRNTQGILDIHTFFNAPDGPLTLEILERRRVRLIMLCPASDQGLLGQGGDDSVFHRLVEGPLPPWADEVELPRELAGTFRLYRVNAWPQDPVSSPE